MLSHTLVSISRRVPAPALVALAIALLVPAAALATPASGQPAAGAAVPSTAVVNAALSAAGQASSQAAQDASAAAADPVVAATDARRPQSAAEAQAAEALQRSLRELARRDSDFVSTLLYETGQDPQQQQQPQGAQQESTREPYDLSLLDAVEMALRNNLSVQVARYNPQNQYEGITAAKATFDPNLSFSAPTFSRGSSPTTTQTQGADVITSTSLSGTGFQWSENLEWGTNYSIRWQASRSSNNNAFNTFNPTISSFLSGNINQPLLRGFGEVNRAGLKVSMIGYESSLEGFRGSVQSVVLQTIIAYWNLRAAMAQLDVQQESLDLALQQFERNRIQVQIGTLAPIEMVQAETQRENANVALIQAQLTLENTQDQLKELLNFDAVVDDPLAYDLVPTDEPETSVPALDVNEAIQTALANDPSLRQQRLGLQSAQISLESARNALLPNLSVSASFNLQGRGGDRFIRALDDFGAPVTEVQQTSFWAAQAQILSGDFNSWSVGANLSFPLHNYSAKASHARASIGERQAVTQLGQAEQNLTYTVRNNVRQVENLARQVEAASLASDLARRQLEAEQRKFDVGNSTNFNVLNMQNTLSSTQVRELNAILNLQRAIAQLEASKGTLLESYGVSIEQAGVGGGRR